MSKDTNSNKQEQVGYIRFRDDLKEGQIANCYVFYGEEEKLKQKALQELRKVLLPPGLEDMNETKFTDPEADELIAACETIPFGCERRLVIVYDCKDLLKTKKKEESKEDSTSDTNSTDGQKPSDATDSTSSGKAEASGMAAYIPKLPPTVCLVFYIRGKELSQQKALYKACAKYGSVFLFDPNDQSITEETLKQTICKRVNAKNCKISEATATYLLETVGRLSSVLEMEIIKLVNYVGEGQTITEKDIQAICTPTPEYTVFQIVDDQVAGRLQAAFLKLNNLYKQGEDSMFMLAMLLRQYRILYHMRCLIEERVDRREMASLLGISPYAVDRTGRQAMRYGKEQLRLAYETILDIEFRVKQGKLPADHCAEYVILLLNQMLNQKGAAVDGKGIADRR